MSCDLSPDSFHVKKGGVRKTVSKRRAYVATPSQIAKKLQVLIEDIEDGRKTVENGGIIRQLQDFQTYISREYR